MTTGHYHFNYYDYAIPLLAIASFVFCLGVFVMIRERLSRIGFIFLLTSLSTGLYVFSIGMAALSMEWAEANRWILSSCISSVFIPWTVFFLAAAVLDKIKRLRGYIAWIFALSVLFAGSIIFSDAFLRPMHQTFYWGDGTRFGPLAWIFITYFFIMALVVLLIYWRAYTESTDEKAKKRFLGIFISVCVGLPGIVDILPGLRLEFYLFGSVSITCYTAGMAYVITRYRLQNISPKWQQTRFLRP